MSASSDSTHFSAPPSTPTLHLHDPSQPLPTPPAYLNASFYLFQPSRVHHPRLDSHSPSPSNRSKKSKVSKRTPAVTHEGNDGIPVHKKEFEKFHGENGVRTVMGSIGPVQNGKCIPPFSLASTYTCCVLQSECYSSQVTDMYTFPGSLPSSMGSSLRMLPQATMVTEAL